MNRVFIVAWTVGVAAAVSLVGCAAAPATSEDLPTFDHTSPVVATVWYRGVPAGVPRPDDLGAIRAYDFEAFVWPAGSATPVEDVRRMAETVGLTVVEAAPAEFLTPASSLAPDGAVTIDAGPSATSVFALAWRAVAHGARTIAFDAREAEGAGFTDVDDVVRPWVSKARAVARQLTFNREFFEGLQPGPAATIVEPRPSGLEVVILQTDKSWVLVATNTSDMPLRAVARIPEPVPPALWVNLLDGIEMSMLNQPGGPRWTFDIDADGALFYAIDK